MRIVRYASAHIGIALLVVTVVVSHALDVVHTRLVVGWRRFRYAQAGQGLVEYGLILVLVGVVVIGVLTTLGTEVDDVFREVECTFSGGTWHQDQGQGVSNKCK